MFINLTEFGLLEKNIVVGGTHVRGDRNQCDWTPLTPSTLTPSFYSYESDTDNDTHYLKEKRLVLPDTEDV